MRTTRISLLMRVRNPDDDEAWRQFDSLYRPMIFNFARSQGIDQNDAEDIAQTCFHKLVKKIREFEYDPTKGRFRGWLKRIVINDINKLRRDRREQTGSSRHFDRRQNTEPTPDKAFESILLAAELGFCLERIRSDFEPKTVEAFHRTAIQQLPVDQVCRDLQMNRNQVYVAKSRVTGRIREWMAELVGVD